MGDTYLSTFNNVGKKQSSFTDALNIAEEILSHEFDSAEIAYNSFVNVVSYKPTVSSTVIFFVNSDNSCWWFMFCNRQFHRLSSITNIVVDLIQVWRIYMNLSELVDVNHKIAFR